MRIARLISGSLLASTVLVLPTQVAQGQADLTATPAAITATVLAGKSPQPITVAITASLEVPEENMLSAAALGDLVREDSAARIPASKLEVAVTRDSTDTTLQVFTLTVTPDLDGADPGKYSGSIRVSGPGVNPLIIPVTVSLQGGSAWGALLLLFLGLVIGWVLKWYTDSGSKLVSQSRRYRRVLRILAATPAENMPKFVINELGDADQGLAEFDQAKVDAALKLLEGQLGGLAAVTNAVAHLRNSLTAHDNEISARSLPYPQVVRNERRRVNDALNEATDLAGAKDVIASLSRMRTPLRSAFRTPRHPFMRTS